MLKYKRVSLKLSGEAMGGGKTIDFAAVAAIAREIKTLVEAAAAWIGTARIRWACLQPP